jgi:hypothetical protein
VSELIIRSRFSRSPIFTCHSFEFSKTKKKVRSHFTAAAPQVNNKNAGPFRLEQNLPAMV